MRLAVVVSVLLSCLSVQAAEVTSIRQVGAHHPVLVFKKNENRQNIMVIYTKLTRDCRFQDDAAEKRPVFDFYWLMDGRNFKPVHDLIKSGVRDRLAFDVATKMSDGPRSSFWIKINDMKEMNHDIRDPRLLIRSLSVKEKCNAEALITLGPSDRGATIRLVDIDTEARKSILPPFRKLVSVTLNGIEVKTGRKISRKFRAR